MTREEFFKQAQIDNYKAAKASDPKAVAEFEKAAQARRGNHGRRKRDV